MVAVTLPFAGAGLILSPMALAIKSLYGMLVEINTYLDKHIRDMKSSENPTVARSGRVLEMAKVGFGLGYTSSIVIIATGQLLLGNTLAAVGTVGGAVIFTNPVAMTCAAIGAIYYGWGALSDTERNDVLARLSNGLEVGIELIKAIVTFIIDKTAELLKSSNLEEIKKYVGSAAAVFGQTLREITQHFPSIVTPSIDQFKEKVGEVIDKTGNLAGNLISQGGDVIDQTATVASRTFHSAKDAAAKVAASAMDAMGKDTPLVLPEVPERR